MSEEQGNQAVGELMALLVHDLRNPVATVSANISFVREVMDERDPDVREAFDDIEIALGDLMRGLEQVGFIARWMEGGGAVEAGQGELGASIQLALTRLNRSVPVHVPPGSVRVLGGGSALARLVELLLANAFAHADPASVEVRGEARGSAVVLEVRDGGSAVAPELREHAFTLAGQNRLKGRADGRYGRVGGLLAARALAEAIGATLEADGVDGQAVFRVWLHRAGA
ncbi:MAG: sensor histidine kinase [Sandaracinaceae bacterium]